MVDVFKYGVADLCGKISVDDGTSELVRKRADIGSEEPHRFPTLTVGFRPEIEDKQKYFVGSQNFLFLFS